MNTLKEIELTPNDITEGLAAIKPHLTIKIVEGQSGSMVPQVVCMTVAQERDKIMQDFAHQYSLQNKGAKLADNQCALDVLEMIAVRRAQLTCSPHLQALALQKAMILS